MNEPVDSIAGAAATRAAERQAKWRGYLWAVVMAIATLWLRMALGPWLGDRPLLILFVIPLVLSAYLWGFGPGLICTAVVGVTTAYFVMPPAYSFAFVRPLDFAQWLILVLIGVIINVFNERASSRRHGTPAEPDARKYQSTERKVQGGFAIALACLALVGIVSYLSVARLTENAAWVNHTRDVISRLDSLLAKMNDAQNSHRGYAITGDETYLEPYAEAQRTVTEDVRQLRELIADNPQQRQRLAQVESQVNAQLMFSSEVIAARRSQGYAGASSVMLGGNGKRLHDELRTSINEMKSAEESLLGAREQDARRSSANTKSVIIGGGILAFAFAGLALVAIRRDFAGRQRAEAELDRFFSLSLDFLCIASTDGYFKRVSPAVTDILGWTPSEFLGRPFIDFVHEHDHRATMLEVEKQIVRGEKVLQFENRYRHKDGSWRVLSWRSMPQPNGLMYATARDVTEHKHIEQAMRDANEQLELRVAERTAALVQANTLLSSSERRFRALLEHGSDSIALINAENKILYLSPAVTAVEGYTPEELLGRSGIEHTHPDDLPLVQEIVRKLMAAPGKPLPVLWRRRHKNGQWIWLEGVATNLLDDPAVGGIVTNYRDVTERKQAESKLQAQLAQLALLSQITRAIGERQDIRSIFQVVIRTLEEQLPVDFACLCLYDAAARGLTVTCVGVRSATLAMELALTEQAHVDIDENGLSQCVRGSLVYEPDMSLVPFPFPQRLSNSGLHSMVAAPLLSEGKVFGVLITARLQTAAFGSGECEFLRQLSEHVALAAHQAELYSSLHTAYDDLRQTQQAVMQQERLRVLGQMASGIAHDINNAISPITLYTESLLEKEPNLSERTRSYLQTMLRAIGDVADTVTRMREFYRQREPQLALGSVSLNELVPQVVELTRARWADMPQQRGNVIEIKVELAAALPPIVGVESDIREALTNLIFNAVDAMPQGGTLTLSTTLNNDADNSTTEATSASTVKHVQVAVTDTGVGMDDETRRRCMELFFTTKGERGTGLGLAMVYGMVQRHSAEIRIDSAPGKGTKVSLNFTIFSGATPAPAPMRHSMPEELKILVVDDDPVLLKSLHDTLESDGYMIALANGGQDGIDQFMAALGEQSPFDIVITDLGMPFVDGRKVADAIKAAAPSTPVIMLTGWGQRLAIEGEMPAHVDRVLNKPPRLRELRTALAELAAKDVAAPSA